MRRLADAREVEDFYDLGPGAKDPNDKSNLLGEGTYGKVYKGFHKKTKQTVAVK